MVGPLKEITIFAAPLSTLKEVLLPPPPSPARNAIPIIIISPKQILYFVKKGQNSFYKICVNKISTRIWPTYFLNPPLIAALGRYILIKKEKLKIIIYQLGVGSAHILVHLHIITCQLMIFFSLM